MIVDGLAIVVGTDGVYAVDVSNGDLAWDVARAGGPISMPAVASGRPRTLLYVEVSNGDTSPSPTTTPSPTGDGTRTPSPSPTVRADAGSALVALDLADQSELWRAPLDAVSRTGVTVDGDTAYVGTDDGTLYAVDVADGAVRWTAEMPGRVDVSLAVADGLAVAISRGAESRGVAIAAYDTDGSRLWQIAPQVGATASSSATLDDGIVVVALADRLVRALDAEDGQERWASLSLQLFSPESSSALDDEALFVADLGGGLYRFDAANGERAWSYQFNEVALRSSPVVSGGSVLLGLNDGRMVAVDATSGRLVWQGAASPGLIGAIALSSDAAVAVKGGDDGGLIAFENDPDGRLVDVPSPTELEAGTTLGRIGVAAAIALAALLLPGILLRRRFGRDGLLDVDAADDAEEES